MPRPSIPESIRRYILEQAKQRCGYCLSRQDLMPIVLEVEHIVPLSQGGSNDITNLWVACSRCNKYKSDKIAGLDPETSQAVNLFNPRTQSWFEHFRLSKDGSVIEGLTPIGRATVIALDLNAQIHLQVRENWVRVGLASAR